MAFRRSLSLDISFPSSLSESSRYCWLDTEEVSESSVAGSRLKMNSPTREPSFRTISPKRLPLKKRDTADPESFVSLVSLRVLPSELPTRLPTLLFFFVSKEMFDGGRFSLRPIRFCTVATSMSRTFVFMLICSRFVWFAAVASYTPLRAEYIKF